MACNWEISTQLTIKKIQRTNIVIYSVTFNMFTVYYIFYVTNYLSHWTLTTNVHSLKLQYVQ